MVVGDSMVVGWLVDFGFWVLVMVDSSGGLWWLYGWATTGSGGGVVLILVVWLILDFSYGGRW